MTQIALTGVTKVFDSGVAAVRDLSLDVESGDLLVLVGPSGCGKTTTLRLIAGLENPSRGEIRMGGEVVNALPPRKRNLSMVFQRPALYPTRTVRENLLFGLKLRHPWGPLARLAQRCFAPGRYAARRAREKDWQERAGQVARTLGLADALDAYPWQLSGGQQQRVALGRALLREPAAFLLDEPLSHLDSRLRLELRSELHLLHKRLRATMVYVTHDPAEALALGDRVAVLRGGELQQVGPPQALRQRPANRFVADFLGPWPLNFLDGELAAAEPGGLCFRAAGLQLTVPEPARSRWVAHAGRRITVGIGPADVLLAADSYNETSPARGGPPVLEVILVEPTETGSLVTGRCGDWKLTSLVGPERAGRVREGQTVPMEFRWQNLFLFDRDSGRTLPAEAVG